MSRITFTTIDIIIIAVYFAATLLIGIRARSRKSGVEDYFLAGRRLTLPAFVATLVASWYGGILGVGEFSYLHGVSNWVAMGLPYYIFAGLFALLLAARIRRGETLTIPDRLYEHYGRWTGLLGSVFIFLLTTPAAYVLMLGVLLQLIFGWSLAVGITMGALLSLAYVYVGGFNSVVVTDRLQFILMFVGFISILSFAVWGHGGIEFLSENLPEKHLTLTGENNFGYIMVWFFIALWTMVDPSFHQRCSAARTPSTAKKGILISVAFWFFFDFLTTTTGLYARAILPGIEPLNAYPLLAEAVLPPVFKGIFFVGLLATIMSTVDSLSLIAAGTVGRDIIWRLSGEKTEERITLYTRLGLVATGLLSVSIALLLPSVVKIWYSFGTLFIPALLLPVVSSYFPKYRLSPKGTLAVMLAGWLSSTGWYLAGNLPGAAATAYPLGIEPIYPGLIASFGLHAILLMRKDE